MHGGDTLIEFKGYRQSFKGALDYAKFLEVAKLGYSASVDYEQLIELLEVYQQVNNCLIKV